MTIATYDDLVAAIEEYLDRDNTTLVARIPDFINFAEIRCAREVKNLGLKTSVVSSLTAGQCVYLKPVRWLEVVSVNYGTYNGNSYTTTSKSINASGHATVTLSQPHDFIAGQLITVTGLGDDAFGNSYDGDFNLLSVTTTTVTYDMGGITEGPIADTDGVVQPQSNIRTTLYPRSLEYCNEYWPDRSVRGEPKFYADYNYDNWLIVPTPTRDSPMEVTLYQRPLPLSSLNQVNWLIQYVPDLLLYAALIESAPYLKNDQRIQTWKDYYLQSLTAIKNENSERKNDASIKRQE